MSHEDSMAPSADPSIATGANRRTAEREFPRRTSVRLFLGDGWREFQVLDESDGGLGIFAGSCEGLLKGSFVLVFCEVLGERKAEIRYAAPHPRGGFHIGLMWATR
ncbi:hypothetical protein K2X85_11690 [bacterium]|nr:hypothetical protein [bacterium]